jgi:hypothetical protein
MKPKKVEILYFADSPSRGCGATVRFGNGEPCMLSIAQIRNTGKKEPIRPLRCNSFTLSAPAHLPTFFPTSCSLTESRVLIFVRFSMPFYIAVTQPKLVER